MESIVKDAVLDHLLNKFNMASYLRGLVFLIYWSLLMMWKSSHIVDAIYLDFQKAFDKVHVGRLMRKTRALGVQGKCGTWINSWLLDRSQRVVINGEVSSWKKVTSGVPHSSVFWSSSFLNFQDL